MRAALLCLLLAITPSTAAPAAPAQLPTLVAQGVFVQMEINNGLFIFYMDKDGFLNYVGPYQAVGNRYQLRLTKPLLPGDGFRINAQPDGSHVLTILE